MRQMMVLLTVLVMILMVILSSASASESLDYLSNTVYQGQSVYLDNEELAYVNDEPARVIHTGMVFSDSFEIKDVMLLNEMNTVVADHTTGGNLGTPTYLFTNITSTTQELGTDLELDDWDVQFDTTFEKDDGTLVSVYMLDNVSVGVSETDYSLVESNGRFLLLQQSMGELTAAEIEEPFALSEVELISLGMILVVVAIIAYWYNKTKVDWRFG